MRTLWPLTLVVTLAACTPTAGPSASTTPAPSYTCSLAGSTPSPCSQADYEKTQAQKQLATEAEQVYRRAFAEEVRILRAGNVTEPTPEMEAVLAEEALADSLALYRDNARDKVRFVGGKIQLKSVEPNFSITMNGSTVMLQTCRDASSASIETDGRKTGRGRIVGERAFLRPVDGHLKIILVQSREQSSC